MTSPHNRELKRSATIKVSWLAGQTAGRHRDGGGQQPTLLGHRRHDQLRREAAEGDDRVSALSLGLLPPEADSQIAQIAASDRIEHDDALDCCQQESRVRARRCAQSR